MSTLAFVPTFPFPTGTRNNVIRSPSRKGFHQLSPRSARICRPGIIFANLNSTEPANEPGESDGVHSQSDVSVSTAVSSALTLNAALADAASRSLANLSPGGPPHLAVIFVSARYSVSNVGPTGRHSMDLVVPRLRALIPELKAVLGCTTDGVIGAAPTGDVVEIENTPAVSLTLMRLPGISITPFHVMPDDLPSLDARQDTWETVVGRPDASSNNTPAFLIFSDPTFSMRGELDHFLSGIEYAYPGACVTGALASAGATFAKGHMFCTLPRDILSVEATSLRDSGLVGIALTGNVQLDCLVSPGCRPIGPEMEVRRVQNPNTILEMEIVGKPASCLPATGQLKSIISYATPAERRLLQDHLHIGISLDRPEASDENMLIRDVIGVDLYGGSITVAHDIRVGQRVRFFVLEAEAALAALDQTMQKYKRIELANSLVGYSNPPFGAIIFADVARGRGTFREPFMETRNMVSFAPGVPVSGAFTGGQIGPSLNTDIPEGNSRGPAMLHTAANLVALIRRRSGMSSSEGIDSPSMSSTDVDNPAEE